jgi:Domain of unknown function (DUF1902)
MYYFSESEVQETTQMTITVKAAWDPEARVWFVADSTLLGLHLEGDNLDDLYNKLPGGIEDLTGDAKIEFELVAPGRRAA